MRIFAIICLLFAASAHGFILDEGRLSDAKEAHAQRIFSQLRCVVCQGQSVKDSQADLAIAMRALVREKLQEGKSEAEIFGEMRALYGPDVVLTPDSSAQNILLWYAPLFFAIIGVVVIRQYYKKRK